VLRDPRSLEVRVSFDDFGSGVSSLNYGKDLTVDDLKIAKEFIEGLREGPVNDSIMRLVVDFAHTLGLEITAEGVETERQVHSLTHMRYDLAQGFYFSKPLGGKAAGAFIATNPAWGVSK
jgi:Amt family ammonium transporter